MNDQSFVKELIDEATSKGRPASHRPHYGAPLILLLLSAAAGYGGYRYIDGPKAAPAGAIAPVPALSIVVPAAQARLQDVPIDVTGLGTVAPFNSVTVKPRVSGQIADVVFTEGQTVRAGDVLAHIDARPFLASLHQAQATLAKDQAQLQNSGADLKRTTNLASSGYATGQALDTQKAQYTGLQATIMADQASIESSQTQLDYATLVSPIAGVAGLRMIDAGNMINPSDPGLVVINQLEPIAVVFSVPSEAIGQWGVGVPTSSVAVTALSPDGVRTLATGTLSLVDNHIDPATATIKLKANFANTDHHLKPGQFVNARMQSLVLHDVVTVPSSAIQQSTSGTYVYLVQPDMHLAQRAVTVARNAGDLAVIGSGLAAGDTVVTDGQYSLKPGMTVAPQNAAALADRTQAIQ